MVAQLAPSEKVGFVKGADQNSPYFHCICRQRKGLEDMRRKGGDKAYGKEVGETEISAAMSPMARSGF